jgi:hypothetical protein
MPLKWKFFHQILEWILFFLNLWVHLGHLFFVLSGSNGDYFFGLWLFLINYACGIDRHLPWFLFIRINNAWAPVNDIKEHFGVFWFWFCLRLLAFFTFSFLSPVHRFAFFIYFLLNFVKCYEIWYFNINFLIKHDRVLEIVRRFNTDDIRVNKIWVQWICHESLISIPGFKCYWFICYHDSSNSTLHELCACSGFWTQVRALVGSA